MSTETDSPNTSFVDIQQIVVTPGVCGGRPRVNGTRLTVQNLVILHKHNQMSAEEIVAGYPQLTMSQLYAAMAYYHLHSIEIEERIRRDDQFVDAFFKEHGPGPLNEKLQQRRRGGS